MSKKDISVEDEIKIRHFLKDIERYSAGAVQALTCLKLTREEFETCTTGMDVIYKKISKMYEDDKTIHKHLRVKKVVNNKSFDRGIIDL